MQEGKIIFPVLEKLVIRHCGKLIALPEAPLVQEPCGGGHRLVWSPCPLLKKLFVRYCRKLIALPEAPSSGGFRSAFPALKVLELEDLESFQRWNAVEGTKGEHILLPQLEKLSIGKCPKLIDLPEAPNLSVLEIKDGKQEIFHCVDKYLSSLTKLILRLESTETRSETGCTLIEPINLKEKRNQKSPITVMELGCCNSFFGSGALESWDYFVHLEHLEIYRCDVLVQWPEEVFQSLASLRRLVISNCKNLTGYAQAPLEPSVFERSQHLPALRVLKLEDCACLVEMFNVHASLKSMTIVLCPKLESLFGRQQQGTSEFVLGSSCNEAIMPTIVSEFSSSPMNHFCPCLENLTLHQCHSLSAVLHLPPSLKNIIISDCSSIQVLSCWLDELPRPSLPPCLIYLNITSCAGMLGGEGVLRLPTILKNLLISNNSGLTSLESLSGDPPSLEMLWLRDCSNLASLPNEQQAYGSLQLLIINDCPAIKKLPRCLQQQLGSIKSKELDACFEVMTFKPKTWKEIPRLVRERRQVNRS
ncbi:unnamed protein product [Alopecurus aequalis]